MKLLLYKNDTCEAMILKCIEAVRKLEASKGLTDEEISYKYTHGMCGHLATTIKFILQACGKSGFRVRDFDLEPIGNHAMLITGNFLNGNETYYDINGKFLQEEFEAYIGSLDPNEDKRFSRINANRHDFTCVNELFDIATYEGKPLFAKTSESEVSSSADNQPKP